MRWKGQGSEHKRSPGAFVMAGGVEVYTGWLWRFPPVGREQSVNPLVLDRSVCSVSV